MPVWVAVCLISEMFMTKKLPYSQWRFLSEESSEWVQTGTISAACRDAILGRYETAMKRDSLQKLGLVTVLSLAALLFGFSILLVISHNWASFTAVEKLSIVFGAFLASWGFGTMFAWRKHPVLSETAFFLSVILFGAGIWQISQIFHVLLDARDGIFLWSLGTFAVSLAMRTPAVSIFTAFLLAYGTTEFWWHPVCFSHLDALLPTFAAVGILASRAFGRSERCAAAVRFFWFLALGWWFFMLPIRAELRDCLSLYFAAMGLLLNLIPRLNAHLRERPMNGGAQFFTVCGTLMLGFAMIPYSFQEVWNYVSISCDIDFFLPVCGVSFFLALLTIGGLSLKKGTSFEENTAFLKETTFLFILGLYLTVTLLCAPYFECAAFLPAWPLAGIFLHNLFMMGLGLHFLNLGLHRVLTSSFLFGVLYFILWAVLRYADLFGKAGGMLGTAAIFFGCGLFLCGVSWRFARKKLAQNAQVSEIQKGGR